MDNQTAIIWGGNGQDGFYLSKLLEKHGIRVIKLGRQENIGDYAMVETYIQQYKPAFIFHFAANSTTRHSAMFENHESISTGTLNVLEAVKLHSTDTKVFLSGSAMQFKNEGLPISEHTPFYASSPYSVARIQSVYAGRYYRDKFGLQVYVGYFFNHDSPLRSEQHVNQKIAAAAKRIANGSNEKLTLGNIDVRKEFSYAGDVVEAIWTLVNQDNIHEAIIGTGKAYSIKEWVAYCFSEVGLNWEDFVTIENGFIPEYQVLVSNPAVMMDLGWQPQTSFNQLAKMMLNGQ